jgi:diguanylate cyclase (GGDEF)-like protein
LHLNLFGKAVAVDDVRYAELKVLRAVASRQIEFFRQSDANQMNLGLNGMVYEEMVIYLLEELCLALEDHERQWFVAKLRGELSQGHPGPFGANDWRWMDPRRGLAEVLTSGGQQRLRITYRGLRRIEELRDALRKDRILDDFGVLLSIRYLNGDLLHAIERGADTEVSVTYADMDNFRPINTNFGHDAGDAVMKAYLEVVRDSINPFGEAYRGVGDETVAIVIGQGHTRAVELAEAIRKGVEQLRVEHGGQVLPPVTASIGVATTPPEKRNRDILLVAEGRNRVAKKAGKNRVVADGAEVGGEPRETLLNPESK